MSRQPEREPDQGAGPVDSLTGRWTRFRESRTYLQIICTVGLVGLTALASSAPPGPLERLQTAARWATTHDYDFIAAGRQIKAWVRESGGGFASLQAGAASTRSWITRWVKARVPAPLGTAIPLGSVSLTNSQPVLPADGAVLYGFGWLPKDRGDRFHDGLDILVDVGAPVRAMTDGTVLRVTDDPQLGGLIEVDHGSAVARYAQVEAIRVRPGDFVKKGQAIAAVGRPRGLEQRFEPHLHLEVRTPGNGAGIDPASYLGLGGSKL